MVVDFEDHLEAVRAGDIGLIHQAEQYEAELRADQSKETNFLLGIRIGLFARESDAAE